MIDPVPRVTVVPVGTNPWIGGRSDGIRVNLSGVTEIGPGITISIEPVGFAGEPSGSDPPGEAGNGFERNNGPGNVGLAASSTVTENHRGINAVPGFSWTDARTAGLAWQRRQCLRFPR